MAFANPLNWPPGWKRTQYPAWPTFKATMQTTMADLEKVLDSLDCQNIVITTNQALRLDGGLRTSQEAIPQDTGVALYFMRNGEELCIPCDKFNTVHANLRAVGLTLEYIRRMENYGTSEMVNAAFRGFKALPEAIVLGEHTARAWWEVLGVSQGAPASVVRAAYKALLHEKHPDKGGSDWEFEELQKAIKESGVA